MSVQLKRIYETAARDDGYRVLIDRLWPRGVSKDKAGVDLWCKEVAPSNELRKWFNHDEKRWDEFKERYRVELKETDRAAALSRLRKKAKKKKTTLLYATKAQLHHGLVLQKLL